MIIFITKERKWREEEETLNSRCAKWHPGPRYPGSGYYLKYCSGSRWHHLVHTACSGEVTRGSNAEREIIFIGTPNLCSPHHRHRPTVIWELFCTRILHQYQKQPPHNMAVWRRHFVPEFFNRTRNGCHTKWQSRGVPLGVVFQLQKGTADIIDAWMVCCLIEATLE